MSYKFQNKYHKNKIFLTEKNLPVAGYLLWDKSQPNPFSCLWPFMMLYNSAVGNICLDQRGSYKTLMPGYMSTMLWYVDSKLSRGQTHTHSPTHKHIIYIIYIYIYIYTYHMSQKYFVVFHIIFRGTLPSGQILRNIVRCREFLRWLI